MIEKLYTVEEVAELASVTGRTIRNYLKSGRLVGRKIGGQWRFPEAEVQRLLTGGEPDDTATDEGAVAASAAPDAATPDAASALGAGTGGPLPNAADTTPSNGREDAFSPAQGHPYPQPAPLPSAVPAPGQAAAQSPAQPAPGSPPQGGYTTPSQPGYFPGQPAPAAPAQNPPGPAPQPQPAYAPAAGPPPQPVQPQPAPSYTTAPAEAHAPQTSGFATYEQPPVQPSAPVPEATYYASAPPAPAQPLAAPQPAPQPTAAPRAEQALPLYAPQPYVPPVYTVQPQPAQPAYAPPMPGQLPEAGRPSYGFAAPAMPVYGAAPGYFSPAGPPTTPQPPAEEPAKPAKAPADAPAEAAGDEQAATSTPPPPQLSDVGKRVTRFISEVHDCSHGPLVCAVVDLHQSLSAAKTTSERLALIADEESASGQLCQSFVEFDDRFFIARYTLFGPTPFLLRCLKLIG